MSTLAHVTAALPHIMQHKDFKPQTASMIAHALATVRYRDKHALALLGDWAADHEDSFQPVELSNLVWATALLDMQNDRLSRKAMATWLVLSRTLCTQIRSRRKESTGVLPVFVGALLTALLVQNRLRAHGYACHCFLVDWPMGCGTLASNCTVQPISCSSHQWAGL
jgi:hypothetical protein